MELKNILSLKDKLPSRRRPKNSSRSCGSAVDLAHVGCGLLSEESFIRVLCIERKRAERSRKLFLLMLADVRRLLANDDRSDLPQKLASALSASTRDTDINGWYKDNSILGVIFTEISGADKSSILSTISAKVTTALGKNEIPISFYFFPEELDKQNSECAANAQLYPDLGDSKRLARFAQSMMDI